MMQRLARMIEKAELLFDEFKLSVFSVLFLMVGGCKTGGGVISGNFCGATDVVLRDIVSSNFNETFETE
jgi:hypothetical protein